MVKVMSGMEGYHYLPDLYAQPQAVADERGGVASPPHALEKPAPCSETLPHIAAGQRNSVESDQQEASTHCDTQPVPTTIDDRDVSLSGLAQYMRELRQMTQLSRAVEARIVEQARSGDQASKHQLIEDRLSYIMHMAHVYHVYAEHEDLMDIVGVTNLAVTANIDKALAKNNPVSYLCGIAKREIRNYCFYHSRLMPIKDRRMSPTEAPTVVSLDEQRADMQYRYLGSLAQNGITETGSPYREQLHHALDQLPDHERQVVELRHGIAGSTTRQFMDIAQALAISRTTVYRRYYQALGRLKELVALSLPVR